jgi:AcrR family transcriptional regulator
MAPDKRREQILDSAVALIIDRGLSSCTLEAVSVQARISKPLIYKYFLRLEDLFKALVEREYRYLRGRGLNVLPLDVPFEEIIRRSNLRAMEYLYERGPIMRLLASDRSIAGLVKRQDHDERSIIIDYFTKRFARSCPSTRQFCRRARCAAAAFQRSALRRFGANSPSAATMPYRPGSASLPRLWPGVPPQKRARAAGCRHDAAFLT